MFSTVIASVISTTFLLGAFGFAWSGVTVRGKEEGWYLTAFALTFICLLAAYLVALIAGL